MYRLPTMAHRNVIAQNPNTEMPLHKILHDKHYGKQRTIDHITSISQACCNHTFSIQNHDILSLVTKKLWNKF